MQCLSFSFLVPTCDLLYESVMNFGLGKFELINKKSGQVLANFLNEITNSKLNV